MGKNVADIKLTANSGIELPLPNPKDVKKVLILGNTIGFFGYPGEKCNISNIHGEDAKRFAWMYNCALLGVEFEILGEEEESNYYSDLFQKIKERYGYKVNVIFTVMKCNDDYDRKLNEYIEEMEDTGKKQFDYAIMNPPYDRSLHLKFLEKVIKVADKTINISPVRWLQDPLARYKKVSDIRKYKESILDTLESVKLIYAKDACNMFDAGMSMDLGIYVCGKGGYNPNELASNSIIEKVLNKNCFLEFDENKKDGYRVRLPYITSGGGGHNITEARNLGKLLWFYDGMKDGKPWYEHYQVNQFTKHIPEIPRSIKFNTQQECENFISSFDMVFAKYVEKTLLMDVHVHKQSILWTGDYSKPWTNARFCEYFGITGFISDAEAEPGSEWETILETMKKYA